MRVTPTFLDGAYLAMTAVEGLNAVVDAPRCEMERAFKIDYISDRYSSLIGAGPYARRRRVFAVDWREGRDITGTEDQLRRTVLRVAEQHPGEPILLFRGFMSLFVHTDVDGVAADLAEAVPSELIVVEQGSTDDDWIDGWQRTHEAVLAALRSPTGSDRPVVTGLCVQRQEGDELGNVAEIQRLFERLGLPPARWPLTSGPWSALEGIGPQAPQIAFPYAPQLEGEPEDVVRVGLPMGLELTAELLRKLGAAFDLGERAEAIIDAERARLSERLLPVVTQRLAGRGAVVVGDPQRIVGFWHALQELGMHVPLAVVLRREDAPLPELAPLVEAGTEIITFPEGQAIQQRLIDEAARGSLDVVVGAAIFRDGANMAGLAYVEAGSPYYLEHFSAPAPFMGFDGLLHLADRVDNALQRASYRRRRARR